jgi:phosphoribosylanthranilate isomerase
MSKIKICGITRAEDVRAVNRALPDYTGFVFAAGRRRVSRDQAQHLRQMLNPRLIPAGVFANEPLSEIAELFENGVISIAQLHGGEDESYIRELKFRNIPVIQVIRFGRGDKPSQLADFHLFDSPSGGSGERFDWTAREQTGKPWFLAGGIGAANLESALALNPYAVDVSSAVETNGLKDPDKIFDLVKCVRYYRHGGNI